MEDNRQDERRPRSLAPCLTAEEASGLLELATARGVRPSYIVECFLRDLLAAEGLAPYGNGSDEEEAAARYFHRCGELRPWDGWLKWLFTGREKERFLEALEDQDTDEQRLVFQEYQKKNSGGGLTFEEAAAQVQEVLKEAEGLGVEP